MAILNIFKFPDPIIKKVSEPITEINEEIRSLVSDMAETMYKAPGIGLAAPQIGVLKRLAVIDISKDDEPKNLIVLINPEIIEQKGEVEEEEGCLCVPGVYANVRRSEITRIRATNENGEEFEMTGEGLLSRAFQHEIDHLNGILFIDRVSPLKKSFVMKKIKNLIKEGKF